LNPRPPGYEPDELPAALPRDVFGAEDRNRTGTVFKDRRILSPVRLPVPPLRLNCSISIPCFNGKYYYIVFNFKRQYLIISNYHHFGFLSYLAVLLNMYFSIIPSRLSHSLIIRLSLFSPSTICCNINKPEGITSALSF
jgi:hypothetical protein